ncbi:MAG TPA: DUF503 domain-containing protein [Nitriliruptoraceae bacterium]|nr:DUF503 domain-containing protein [Nitriliruptoraceae bacterium]
MGAHVGAMQVDLHMPEAGSLKGRRAILNKAIAALRRDLDVSVAQVDATDEWQRASLAVAVVASSPAGVDRVLDRVVAVVERDPRVVVIGVRVDRAPLELDGDPTAGLLDVSRPATVHPEYGQLPSAWPPPD